MLADTITRGIHVHSELGADGVEFMPANSYVIRNFTIRLNCFARHRLRVVVVYPDVESEDLAAIYPKPSGFNAASADNEDDGDDGRDGGSGGAPRKQLIRVETDMHDITTFAQLAT